MLPVAAEWTLPAPQRLVPAAWCIVEPQAVVVYLHAIHSYRKQGMDDGVSHIIQVALHCTLEGGAYGITNLPALSSTIVARGILIDNRGSV